MSGHVRGRYTQSDSTEGSTGTAQMLIGCTIMGLHLGDTRRIPLNRRCVWALRLYVKLL